MGERDEDEQELEARQQGALYPIGRALRSTYDAENHDSLGNDLTGLMLALARVGEPDPAVPPPAPLAPAPPLPAPAAAPSWLGRLIERLRPRGARR